MFGMGVVWYTYPYLEAAISPEKQAPAVKIAPVPVYPFGEIH
jgi:hypothetical protein